MLEIWALAASSRVALATYKKVDLYCDSAEKPLMQKTTKDIINKSASLMKMQRIKLARLKRDLGPIQARIGRARIYTTKCGHRGILQLFIGGRKLWRLRQTKASIGGRLWRLMQVKEQLRWQAEFKGAVHSYDSLAKLRHLYSNVNLTFLISNAMMYATSVSSETVLYLLIVFSSYSLFLFC